MQLVQGANSLSPIVSKCFQCDVEPDLAAILEAVGHGSSWCRDADGDAPDLFVDYAFGEGSARPPDDVQRRPFEPWLAGLAVDPDPHLGGVLGCQLGHAQCRQEFGSEAVGCQRVRRTQMIEEDG